MHFSVESIEPICSFRNGIELVCLDVKSTKLSFLRQSPGVLIKVINPPQAQVEQITECSHTGQEYQCVVVLPGLLRPENTGESLQDASIVASPKTRHSEIAHFGKTTSAWSIRRMSLTDPIRSRALPKIKSST